MHRIFPIQKRVIQVNLPLFNNTVVQPLCLTSSPCSIATRRKETQGFQFPVQESLFGIKGIFGWRKSRNDNTFLKVALSSDSTTKKNDISGQTDDKENKQQPDTNFDTLGAWDNHMDLPIMMDESIKHGTPIPRVTAADVGCSSILGKRTYQEDRFVVADLLNNILCAAVFDGHGGSECSEFCAQNLERLLLEHLPLHKDLEAVLHHTFLKLHSEYAAWATENDKGLRAGSTATVCLLRGGVELAVGHVGDSRAILCRSGRVMELSYDHCPSLTSEKARIQQSGGRVIVDNIGRHLVNEALNMSRSIGDLHLKQYGVIALPDTRSIRVKHGKDAFLLLNTDGVNFVLRNEETCNIVNNAEIPPRAAELLTEQALSMSSEDNMTALVIPFGSWGKYTTSASMFYSFGIGRDMNKSSRFG